MKVKFLTNHVVQAADGETYREGQVVEMSAESALHFTRRGLAVVVDDVETAAVEPDTEKAVAKRGKPRKV